MYTVFENIYNIYIHNTYIIYIIYIYITYIYIYSDDITIRIPYRVDDLLHRPASHPVISYWVC